MLYRTNYWQNSKTNIAWSHHPICSNVPQCSFCVLESSQICGNSFDAAACLRWRLMSEKAKECQFLALSIAWCHAHSASKASMTCLEDNGFAFGYSHEQLDAFIFVLQKFCGINTQRFQFLSLFSGQIGSFLNNFKSKFKFMAGAVQHRHVYGILMRV